MNAGSPVRSHRGQALVPVIFIVIILTVLAVAFATTASREVRATGNYTNQMQRFYAAKGALNYAAVALSQTSNNGSTYGIVPPGPDTDANGWMQIGDSWVKIEVLDTGACINLNTVDAATLERLPVFQNNTDLVAAIMDWRSSGDQASENGAKSDYYEGLTPPYDSKNAPFDTVEELLLVKGMTPSILYGSVSGNPITADALNAANTPSITGSTTTAPDTGTTTGANGTTTVGAQPGDTNWDDVMSSSATPLYDLLTTISRERNVAADGTPRININTASAQDLQDQLGISAALANALVQYRTAGNTNGGTGGTGGTPRPGGNGGGTGGTPRPGGNGGGTGTGGGTGGGGAPAGGTGGGARPGIRSVFVPSRQAPAGGQTGGTGTPGGGTGGTPRPGGNGGGTGGTGGGTGGGTTSGPAFKTIADLMFVPGRQTFDRATMQNIADRVSVDDQPYHENLVNINTAPAEVLATVPGMDHTILQEILNYRQNGQAFQSLGDLFSIQNLTRQQYINVISHLTTKTSVYRVRIKVRTPGQPSVYAVSALVELTDNGPRIRQWREVPRTPGWSTWITPVALPTPTPPAAPTTSGTTSGTG